MGKTTGIAWCHHTFNPWWGCKRVSRECIHCYAEKLAHRWGLDVWGGEKARRTMSDNYWRQPVKWNREAIAAGERRRVFCASMADVFEDHPQLPPLRERLWGLIEATPGLDWLLLTKRPENMRAMAPWAVWPDHVWAGTSVGLPKSLPRLEWLLGVPARVHFVSVEPLVEPLSLGGYLVPKVRAGHCVDIDGAWWHAPGTCAAPECGWSGIAGTPAFCCRDQLSWVIVGGESGAGAERMNPDWARLLRDQVLEARVPFFFKQTGTVLAREWGLAHPKGEDPAEWPEEFRVQEVPLVKAVA